jgi:hypothetical protein
MTFEEAVGNLAIALAVETNLSDDVALEVLEALLPQHRVIHHDDHRLCPSCTLREVFLDLRYTHPTIM